MIPYSPLAHIDLGVIQLHWYGVFAALGFFIATLLLAREAQKRGIPKATVESLAGWLIIGGIIGARLGYILLYWSPDIPLTLWSAIKIWEGGLAWFGGFIGALMVGWAYLHIKRLDFWKYADIFTVPLIVGHIFGRIGDYVTGGHPGKITTLPWGIYMDGALRHPVVLYEILGLLIILTAILCLKKVRLFDGFVFLSYVMLYSVQRIFLDFFRLASTDPRYFGLTPSQYISIALFVLAGVIMGVETHFTSKSIRRFRGTTKNGQ